MLPNEGQHSPEGQATGHRGSGMSAYPAPLSSEPGSGSIAGNLMRQHNMQAFQQYQHAIQTPHPQTGVYQQPTTLWGAAAMHAAAQTAHSTCGAPVTRTFSPGGTALQGYANDFGASCLNSAAGSYADLAVQQQMIAQQQQHAMRTTLAMQQQSQQMANQETMQRYATMPMQQTLPVAIQQFQPRSGRATPPSPLWAQQMAAEASQQLQSPAAVAATPQRNLAWGERPVFPHSEPDTEPVRASQWQWGGEPPPGQTGRRNSAPGHLADFRAPEQARERSRERDEEESHAAETEEEREARLRRYFGGGSTSMPRSAPSTAPRVPTQPTSASPRSAGRTTGILAQIRRLRSQGEQAQNNTESEPKQEIPAEDVKGEDAESDHGSDASSGMDSATCRLRSRRT